jgi:putative transcriptional regulator
VYVGYAGWRAAQLEAEIRQGAWHVFEPEAEPLFDPEPETLWRRQIRRTEALMARSR